MRTILDELESQIQDVGGASLFWWTQLRRNCRKAEYAAGHRKGTIVLRTQFLYEIWQIAMKALLIRQK